MKKFEVTSMAVTCFRCRRQVIHRPLSELLVSGAIQAGDNVRVDVEGEKIVFRQLQLEDSGEETL